MHEEELSKQPTYAFSLVELSIVLVILGLLVGGVLSGQALIRAAELRSVTSEFSRYITAAQTFRDKYFALPGDMNNATQFWGRKNTNSDCVTNSGAAVNASAGTCDGNANGAIELPSQPNNPSVSGESYQFWHQLQLAGIIEGQATGLTPASGVFANSTITPQSKSGTNSYWWIASDLSPMWGTAEYPSKVYGRNTFFLGSPDSGGIEWVFYQEEMWNIDKKIDDGIPTDGNVVSDLNGWGGATACVTGATFPNNGVYYMANRAKSCSFAGIAGF